MHKRNAHVVHLGQKGLWSEARLQQRARLQTHIGQHTFAQCLERGRHPYSLLQLSSIPLLEHPKASYDIDAAWSHLTCSLAEPRHCWPRSA